MQELSNVISKKYDEVIDKIKSFSDEYLNESYKNVCSNAAKVLFDQNEEAVKKGKSISWAAGIVHAIGSINDLFDSKEEPYIKATDLYKAFEVSSSTVNAKSKEVKTLLNISENDEEYMINSKNENGEKQLESEEVNKDEFNFVVDKKYNIAQKIVDMAWKDKSYTTRHKFAMQAISVYKDCADAYILLSTNPKLNDAQKIKYLRKAVKASENTLHITNLEQADERVFSTKQAEAFFGARYLLAKKLWVSGDHEKAIRNALQIVKYDKKDKLIARGLVSTWLLLDNRNDEAKIFLENMKNDYLAEVNYNRAAMFYRNGMEQEGETALKRAFSINPNVIPYLTREKLVPKIMPRGVKIGSVEEAIRYAHAGVKIWNDSKMIKWLVECKERFDIAKLGNDIK